MKYIFRGYIVFEYFPEKTHDKVEHHLIEGKVPTFNFCSMIDEDYKLLSEFFDRVYRHTQGEDVDLSDVEV